MSSEAPGGEPARGFSSRLGPYDIVRRLARGGMANVYLARRGGQHVALKVLDKSRIADGEAYSMFLDEARVVQMLDHHNIAAVLDVDVIDDELYLAMEYIHGVDLRELLGACMKRGFTLPYDVAIAVISAAAAGLHHAHHRTGPDGTPLRLVHRDVSLSNIMVGHDGGVKVVDFGIATSALASVHTMPGIVRGKASYMSPEQCLGDKIDCRADVFALGVVLYELTTGARCFSGKTDFDRMLAVVRSEFIPPSVLVADYPRELEQLILSALSTDITKRPPSAAAFIVALDEIARARGWSASRTNIVKLMRDLYGIVAEPWADEGLPTFDDSSAPVAEVNDTVKSEPLPLLAATRTRLARGSQADIAHGTPVSFDQWRAQPEPEQAPTLDDAAPPLNRVTMGAMPEAAGSLTQMSPPPDADDDSDDNEPTSSRAALRSQVTTIGYAPLFA